MKTILAYILILNLLFTPVYLFFVVRDLNRVYHIDDYKLLKVKITDITYKNDWESDQDIDIEYQTHKDKNEIDNIRFPLKSKNYEHFKKLVKRGVAWEVFHSKTSPQIGGYMWVWHNSYAEDFYAFGKNDSFLQNKKHITKTLIIVITLLTVTIINISFGLTRKLLQKKN